VAEEGTYLTSSCRKNS